MESTLVVAENVEGKFGPQVKDTNGEYYSFGKFYTGPKSFANGAQLKVELYVTERNNKYINKVLENISNFDKPTQEVNVIQKRGRKPKEFVPPVKTTSTEVMYKPRDYDKEARGKTRCAAMTSILSPILPILVTNPQNMDEVLSKARELADFVVEYSFNDNDSL